MYTLSFGKVPLQGGASPFNHWRVIRGSTLPNSQFEWRRFVNHLVNTSVGDARSDHIRMIHTSATEYGHWVGEGATLVVHLVMDGCKYRNSWDRGCC